MRIVHFSDFHLSAEFFHEFEDFFLPKLCDELNELNKKKRIDLIIITGDLVDRGGLSLFTIPKFKSYNCPFEIFKVSFIDVIVSKVKLNQSQFLFIPGNHDITEKYTEEIKSQILNEVTTSNINEYLTLNENPNKFNSGIIKFKEFEKKFHKQTSNYFWGINESYYFHDYKGRNIGFVLVNDSWLCKASNSDGKLLFGHDQIDKALLKLNENNCKLNICWYWVAFF